MKIITLVAAILLCACSAQAIINPEDNVIGPYFDESADLDCIEGVDMNTQLPIYIILTRPTFSEIYGFELGLDYGNNLVMIGQNFSNSEALNVGSGNEFIVGFGSPTYTSDATILLTLSMLHLGTQDTPTFFALRGSQPSSLDPAFPSVLLSEGEIISTALHSEFRPYTYLINGQCGFEDEGRSWDGVKSLYRR
jgi:hypothetical protein